MSPKSAKSPDHARPTAVVRTESPARMDWRLMLGVSRDDSVLVIGKDAVELARGLAPWVGQVHSSTRDGVGADPEPGDANPTRIREQPESLSLTGPLDWIIFDGPLPGSDDVQATIAHALPALKPGGRVVLAFDNRWGLGGWLRAPRSSRTRGSGAVSCRGLGHALRLVASAGCTATAGYAALPNRRAPRTLIPLAPPCPPAAEKFALDQAWKRATPARTLGRLVLHLLIDLRVLRYLYPHYLVVGRKSC